MPITVSIYPSFESLDVRNSSSHIWHISREYWSTLYMKVIERRSRSQQQNAENSYCHNV